MKCPQDSNLKKKKTIWAAILANFIAVGLFMQNVLRLSGYDTIGHTTKKARMYSE